MDLKKANLQIKNKGGMYYHKYTKVMKSRHGSQLNIKQDKLPEFILYIQDIIGKKKVWNYKPKIKFSVAI